MSWVSNAHSSPPPPPLLPAPPVSSVTRSGRGHSPASHDIQLSCLPSVGRAPGTLSATLSSSS